ncbi:MAG: M23 family metallopeptidase [Candidatus Nanopelagicales bacterium]
MKASRGNVLQAGGLAVVVASLLLGAEVTQASGADESAEAPPAVSAESEEVSLIGQPVSAERMADAATAARRQVVARQKRARALAQRSSGDMLTPTRNYTYSAVFGQPGGWSSGYHTGLDFATASGTPVLSALAGEVVQAGWDGAYGNRIIVRHDNGVKTLYAHLSSTSVNVGDKVTRGQRIGAVGTTGNSSGPHLHFEVIKKGTQRDPKAFL